MGRTRSLLLRPRFHLFISSTGRPLWSISHNIKLYLSKTRTNIENLFLCILYLFIFYVLFLLSLQSPLYFPFWFPGLLIFVHVITETTPLLLPFQPTPISTRTSMLPFFHVKEQWILSSGGSIYPSHQNLETPSFLPKPRNSSSKPFR